MWVIRMTRFRCCCLTSINGILADLCGYVRNLLKVRGEIFNTVPIARVLEMPEELINQVVMSWRGEDEQLNTILQRKLGENYMAEDITSLSKDLDCWRKTKQG